MWVHGRNGDVVASDGCPSVLLCPPCVVSVVLLLCAQLLTAQIAVNPPRRQVEYTLLYTEGTTVGPGTGILLGIGASVETDPTLVIGNRPSIRLDSGNIGTDPAVWPLAPNTTYIVELQYRIVNRRAGTDLLYPTLSNSGQQPQLHIHLPALHRNAEASGTYSSGALTNSSSSYVLNINAGPGVSIIVGNIVIYRQDTVQTTTPPAWSKPDTLPFPRLGAWYSGHPDYDVASGSLRCERAAQRSGGSIELAQLTQILTRHPHARAIATRGDAMRAHARRHVERSDCLCLHIHDGERAAASGDGRRSRVRLNRRRVCLGIYAERGHVRVTVAGEDNFVGAVAGFPSRAN